jgi:hypothetical protein
VPSAERLAERLEIHRELAEAVSRLEEPFREVVLLRYYQDLTSAEIARRLDEPAGTIRWRLKTGLDRLRVALDERRGGARRAWMAALIPLARLEERAPPAARPPGFGTLAVTLGVAGLVVVAVLVGRGQRSAVVAGSSAAASDSNRPRGLVAALPMVAPAVSGAGPSPVAEEVPAWIRLEGAPPRVIAGRVISEGRPVGGARLRLSSATLTSARLDRQAVARPDGTFAFPGQPITDWLLTAWAPGLQPAIHYLDLRRAVPGALAAGRSLEALVIELPPCRVFASGTVRDAGGGVIASAQVRLVAGRDDVGTEARTDSSGRYQLCIPGGNPQSQVLTAEASGYGGVEARAPSEGGTVDFMLEAQAIVAGRAIRKAGGEPAPGVDLVLLPVPPEGPNRPTGERRQAARRESRTDEAGRFELTGVAAGRYTLRFASDELFGMVDDVLTVGPGEQVRGLEVGLLPVALVEGVTSRGGAPAAHVDLRFTPPSGTPVSPGPRRTRSDQQGHFRVRVPQDLPLTVETVTDPDRFGERWTSVLAPGTFVPGKAHRVALEVELPPAGDTAAEVREFVSLPGTSPPPPGHALEGQFGDQVRLLGYDLGSDRVHRGGAVEVTLHFQVLAPLQDGRLFSHLVGPGGFTNLDNGPVRGAHPVPRWRTGETIRDRFTISIAPEFPPGTYNLLVGFWRPAGNRRLAIRPTARDDGEGRFRVLSFTVE